MIITVDGLPASGKGSLARALGEHYRLPVLDTGALWRIMALQQQRYWGSWKVDPKAHETIDYAVAVAGEFPIELQDSPEIRSQECGELASVLSGNRDIRYWIDQIQTEFVADGSGILDGRECGISIAPQAEHKFFLQADVGIRAEWRARQLHGADGIWHRGSIKDGLITRDRREINRSVSPIRPAPDAIIITSSAFGSSTEVFDFCRRLIDFRQDWARTLKLNQVSA